MTDSFILDTAGNFEMTETVFTQWLETLYTKGLAAFLQWQFHESSGMITAVHFCLLKWIPYPLKPQPRHQN